MFTTEASSTTISVAREITVRAAQRRGSGSRAPGCRAVVLESVVIERSLRVTESGRLPGCLGAKTGHEGRTRRPGTKTGHEDGSGQRPGAAVRPARRHGRE
ncbi:hypothetical protein GCM10027612_11790 [Microbispora bryophytorum subsp. camponoti]